ncbi:MAG TPA: hypothetical protein VE641_17125 [Chthoniobacterales bacterium]|nr:hypothetical protein [Chthoniobacterales bacterium]
MQALFAKAGFEQSGMVHNLDPDDGSTIIHVNGDPDRWRRGCDSVEVVGQFGVPYAMPYENARPIFICHGLRRNLTEIWSRLKRYE